MKYVVPKLPSLIEADSCFPDASAWTAIFIGLSCNKSDMGRKGDTSGGISKLKKERRSCDKRSEGNMSGWVVGRSHRSDGEN